MTVPPPSLFDHPDDFVEMFDWFKAVCQRLLDEFPELESDDAHLSGADAVDRITGIHAEAKSAVAALQRLTAALANP